jgi:hypothetical protein
VDIRHYVIVPQFVDDTYMTNPVQAMNGLLPPESKLRHVHGLFRDRPADLKDWVIETNDLISAKTDQPPQDGTSAQYALGVDC